MADPGFPILGGTNFVGGHKLPIRLHFVKFVCQNGRITTLRGRAPGAPPGPANAYWPELKLWALPCRLFESYIQEFIFCTCHFRSLLGAVLHHGHPRRNPSPSYWGFHRSVHGNRRLRGLEDCTAHAGWVVHCTGETQNYTSMSVRGSLVLGSDYKFSIYIDQTANFGRSLSQWVIF